MSFIKFPKIESFHNIRKWVLNFDEEEGRIRYGAKVKLHGTNAAVQIKPNGEVLAQSRTRNITPGDDNMGFAAWVEETKNFWQKARYESHTLTIYGEWFGEGIMKGTSASKVKGKHFAIFAMLMGDSIFSNKGDIYDALTRSRGAYIPENVHIIPDIGDGPFLDVDFRDVESCENAVKILNDYVEEVENCDPFIRDTFGIEGNGEGIVLYPIGDFDEGVVKKEIYSQYTFKAKGEKHKTVSQKEKVQIDPEVAESIDEFVNITVTPPRLEQAVRECEKGELVFRKSKLGDFVRWISNDIQTECKDELEVSGLSWKDVNKVISNRARTWFLEKHDEIV